MCLGMNKLDINNSNIDAWYDEVSFANLTYLHESWVAINNSLADDQNLLIVGMVCSWLLILVLFIDGCNVRLLELVAKNSMWVYLYI